MREKTVNDWIRTHLFYKSGVEEQFLISQTSLVELNAHTEERLSRALELLLTKSRMVFIKY